MPFRPFRIYDQKLKIINFVRTVINSVTVNRLLNVPAAKFFIPWKTHIKKEVLLFCYVVVLLLWCPQRSESDRFWFGILSYFLLVDSRNFVSTTEMIKCYDTFMTIARLRLIVSLNSIERWLQFCLK